MATEPSGIASFEELIKRGATVATFLEARSEVVRALDSAHREDLRLGRGWAKRFRDEITPVARFAAKHCADSDWIRLPLDCGPIDCSISHGERVRTIQITVAQAKERLILMSELNETGMTSGIIPLNDDQSLDSLREHHARATGYTAAERLDSVVSAAKLCLGKKARSVADTLLISVLSEATEELDLERWAEIQTRLEEAARDAPFSEVFVVVGCTLCWRIK